MTNLHRKRHFRIFIILAILLPLLLISSIAFKTTLKETSYEEEFKRILKEFPHFVYEGDKKTSKNNIYLNLRASSKKKGKKDEKYVLLIKPEKDYQQPDILVYLTQKKIKSSKNRSILKILKKSELIGQLKGDQKNVFFVSSATLKKNKNLLFYSHAFQKVVDQIKLSVKN